MSETTAASESVTTGESAEVAVVRAFLRALEALDLDAALALADESIVYQNVPLPPARGKAAVAKQLGAMTRYGSGFEAQIHAIAGNGPVVLTERTDVLEAGRLRAAFWVCGTFEVRDGRVVLWRDYFDWPTFMLAMLRGAVRAGVSALTARSRGAGAGRGSRR